MDKMLGILIGSLALLATACAGGTPAAAAPTGSGDLDPAAACPTSGEPLDTARLYIEHNATDEDTGVHGLFGGEAWSELCLTDPSGRLIMLVDPRAQLDALTVADLFFESREPENSEYSLDRLRADFPEGEYRVAATDYSGTSRVATAMFTHTIPAEPEITAPDLAEDEAEAAAATVSRSGLEIRWEPVTAALDGGPLTVTGYEVIVTKVEHDDPHGWSRPIYDVHLGPDATSLAVPEEFLEPGTIYELEVLVLEESGNQTISLGFFTAG